MATTIFDITRKDLSPEEFEALQEKARDFLGVPKKDGVEETQEQVLQEVEEKLEYGDFGTPDEKEKDLIKSWSVDFRKKIKGDLKFTYNTIEIDCEEYGGTIIFDKNDSVIFKGDSKVSFTFLHKGKIGEKDLKKIKKIFGESNVDKDDNLIIVNI